MPPSPLYTVTHDGRESSPQESLGEETFDYDGDDVSYRLRLLVNNTYFLPPAHARPNMSTLSPDSAAAIPQKKPTPTSNLLDYFKVGGRSRSKSKPPTPGQNINEPDGNTPALRTASDVTTIQGNGHSAYRSPTAVLTSQQPQNKSVGRIVVVREKMPDLATAAKLAEQDMKSRAGRREQYTSSTADPDIDPTDAVDLPPPSASYPFAVQASAIRGLGVEESIGADMLANHLPPKSPGNSSFAPEIHWRTALLQAAVGHSIDNLQALSSGSHHHNQSTSTMTTATPAQSPPPVPFIHRKISSHISEPSLDPSAIPSAASNATPRRKSKSKSRPASPEDLGRSSSQVPSRAVTPAVPLVPLSPPPRKQIVNPLYSLSQTDLSKRPGPSTLPPSPMLPDTYESNVRQGVGSMTPPPLSLPGKSRLGKKSSDSSLSSRSSRATEIIQRDASISSNASMFSVDEEPEENVDRVVERVSSTFGGNRRKHSGSVGSKASVRTASSSDSAHSASSRRTARSRPISSSSSRLSAIAPPRTSSLPRRPPSIPEITHTSDYGQTSSSGMSSPGLPTTPIFARRAGAQGRALSIDSHRTSFPPAIHSAPPPASPADFFDNLQSQPNAFDELDTSDTDSDDDPFAIPPPQPPLRAESPISTPPRAPFMRLGNHSTPHISPRSSSPTFSLRLPPPVGYTATPRSPALNTKKMMTTLELHEYTRRKSTSSNRSYRQQTPSGSANSSTPYRTTETEVPAYKANEQESMKKLDGMLKDHMQAEKTRMRQIANNIQANASLQ